MVTRPALPGVRNPLLGPASTPPLGSLIERRRLGQTDLSSKLGAAGGSIGGEYVGMFDYAHLRVSLPRDLKGSGVHSLSKNMTYPESYFLMRRSIDGFVSATGMFKAAFPWASLEEELSERRYHKSPAFAGSSEVAGNVWVHPTDALKLAEEYKMVPYIVALLSNESIDNSPKDALLKIARPPLYDIPPHYMSFVQPAAPPAPAVTSTSPASITKSGNSERLEKSTSSPSGKLPTASTPTSGKSPVIGTNGVSSCSGTPVFINPLTDALTPKSKNLSNAHTSTVVEGSPQSTETKAPISTTASDASAVISASTVDAATSTSLQTSNPVTSHRMASPAKSSQTAAISVPPKTTQTRKPRGPNRNSSKASKDALSSTNVQSRTSVATGGVSPAPQGEPNHAAMPTEITPPEGNDEEVSSTRSKPESNGTTKHTHQSLSSNIACSDTSVTMKAPDSETNVISTACASSTATITTKTYSTSNEASISFVSNGKIRSSVSSRSPPNVTENLSSGLYVSGAERSNFSAKLARESAAMLLEAREMIQNSRNPSVSSGTVQPNDISACASTKAPNSVVGNSMKRKATSLDDDNEDPDSVNGEQNISSNSSRPSKRVRLVQIQQRKEKIQKRAFLGLAATFAAG